MMKHYFFILFFVLITTANFCQNKDIELLENINLDRNRLLDPAFKAISGTTGLISFGIPITTLSISLLSEDRVLRGKSIYLIETAVINTVITTALKYTIKRERPFITYPYLVKLDKGGSPSFPSGHTSDAFTLATSLTISYPKWYVAVPSYTWASAVGYSRMHLGVHYPSDVIGGALVGAGSAWLAQVLNRKLFAKKNR